MVSNFKSGPMDYRQCHFFFKYPTLECLSVIFIASAKLKQHKDTYSRVWDVWTWILTIKRNEILKWSMNCFRVEKVGKNTRWVKSPKETKKQGSWELRFLCLKDKQTKKNKTNKQINKKTKVTIYKHWCLSPWCSYVNTFSPSNECSFPFLFNYWPFTFHVCQN